MFDKKGKEIYKFKVKSLVDNIKNILLEESGCIVNDSGKILDLLWKETIKVPMNYVNSFIYTREQIEFQKDVAYCLELKENITIEDLTKYSAEFLNCLKFYERATLNLNKIVDSSYNGDSITIKGNSFGPFETSKYFEDDNLRILWLLKESYIEKGSWLKGDRGGHPQAKYNNTYNKIDNFTIKRVVELTQNLVKQLLYSVTIQNLPNEEIGRAILKLKNENLDDKNTVMRHICVLEVNHFPGLAFNSIKSDDKLIGEWAEENRPLIEQLISFYRPHIIIGGMTLGHFFPTGYRYDTSVGIGNTHNFKHILSGVENVKSESPFKVFDFTIDDENFCHKGSRYYMFKTNDNRFLIDANHPSRKSNFTKEDAQEMGKILGNWISKI